MGFSCAERREWEFAPHASYGLLGWFQHVIKLIAIMVALLSWTEIVAFNTSSVTSSVEDRGELHTARIWQIAILSALLFFYLVNLVMRFWSAEVFAFGFHMLHIAGHVVLLINVVVQFDPSSFVYVYALLMVWGELIQILFLFMRSDDALTDIYDLPMPLIWGYSALLVVIYVILLILQVIVSTATFSSFHGY
eukprot:TRINITY_DN13006_c0_g1_i1.p1 TRINITY_DN13006_c0_g1~~TRINITY_DN13006_c0_g1_i1.p1  ORF type:complete len:193 (-),score=27.81 TRINITY_DN13006_c0_g1_i1:104-682(-)